MKELTKEEKYTLFQKMNGAVAKLYSTILYADEDLKIPQEDTEEGIIVCKMKETLSELEILGDQLIGEEMASRQREHEYAQQRLSREMHVKTEDKSE